MRVIFSSILVILALGNDLVRAVDIMHLGTDAPPSSVYGVTVSPVLDTAPGYPNPDYVSSAGPVVFDASLRAYEDGETSKPLTIHDYIGRIYISDDTQRKSLEMTLPPSTNAFIFYVGVGGSADAYDVTIMYDTGLSVTEAIGFNIADPTYNAEGFAVYSTETMGNPIMVKITVPETATNFGVGQFLIGGCNGACMGDPHFKTWADQWYDFHGECDLVFLENPLFRPETAMDIHIRTKARYGYSHIESVALKLGEDVLEVSAWGQYFVNSVEHADLPAKLDTDYPVTYEMLSKKEHVYNVDLGDGKLIVIRSFKDIVSVDVVNATWTDFGESKGLMGSFGYGKWLGRDGALIADANEFGQEWQVLSTDAQLFETDRVPQHPVKCNMQNAHKKESRRLGESIAEEAAELACAHWDQKELCIYDVMATGDLELAQAGAY